MGCRSLLQGSFLTQRSNLHLLPWQANALPLLHLGSWSICFIIALISDTGVPGGSAVESLPASVGDRDSVPGSGSSPGGGHGSPLQCSCLENPMDRGAWRAAVHSVGNSRTRLSAHSAQTYVLVWFCKVVHCFQGPQSESFPQMRKHFIK